MNKRITVPVIAAFNTKGKIKPIYFEYEDNIIKILSYSPCIETYIKNGFDCIAELDGYTRNIRLIYFVNESKWSFEFR